MTWSLKKFKPQTSGDPCHEDKQSSKECSTAYFPNNRTSSLINSSYLDWLKQKLLQIKHFQGGLAFTYLFGYSKNKTRVTDRRLHRRESNRILFIVLNTTKSTVIPISQNGSWCCSSVCPVSAVPRRKVRRGSLRILSCFSHSTWRSRKNLCTGYSQCIQRHCLWVLQWIVCLQGNLRIRLGNSCKKN